MTKFIASIFNFSPSTKFKLNKLIGSFVLALVLPLAAHAGGSIDTNGGGHTVLVDNQYYLFDLYEMGLIDNLFIGEKPLGNYSEKLVLKNSRFSAVADLVSQKLQDIASRDPILAGALIKAIDLYSWSFVDNNLLPTEPADSAISVEIHQGAVRKGYVVYIASQIWNQMPKEHQAALVIHEVVSALTRDNMPDSRARQLTALIFSNEFITLSNERWGLLVTSMVPTVVSFQSKLIPSFMISKNLQYFQPTIMLGDTPYLWNLKESAQTHLKNICSSLANVSIPLSMKITEVRMGFDRPTVMNPSVSLVPKLHWVFQDKVVAQTTEQFGGPSCLKQMDQSSEMKAILEALSDYR